MEEEGGRTGWDGGNGHLELPPPLDLGGEHPMAQDGSKSASESPR